MTTKASELMATGGDDERRALDEAKEFLLDLLADGPVSAKVVPDEARDAGMSWRTVRRAKEALEIGSRKGDSMGAGWEWTLVRRGPNFPEGVQENAWASSGSDGHLRGDVSEVEL